MVKGVDFCTDNTYIRFVATKGHAMFELAIVVFFPIVCVVACVVIVALVASP